MRKMFAKRFRFARRISALKGYQNSSKEIYMEERVIYTTLWRSCIEKKKSISTL